MRLSLSILGHTFAVTFEPDVELDEEWSEAVTGTPSSVEFGFAPEPSSYWSEEDRRRR